MALEPSEGAQEEARLSEAQALDILREANTPPVVEVPDRHGTSDQTIDGWRKRDGTLGGGGREAAMVDLLYLRADGASRGNPGVAP